MFDSLPVAVNFAIFAALALMIWVAGTRLSYFIDAIAEQTQIARAFLGVLLLATATELPEFVTTLTASSEGKGALALNNMFGGMLLQLLVLAAADYFVKDGTLASRPHSPTVIVAGLLCATSMALIFIFHTLGEYSLTLHFGVGSMAIAALYIASMFVLEKIQGRDVWSPVDLPENESPPDQGRNNQYEKKSMAFLVGFSAVAAVAILIFGVLLVRLADTLATQTGLGRSFVGASLLALTTSMPELSTTIAAVRVKAYTMAISNVFGSNLIMTFLIFPNDLVFTDGPIINEIGQPALFALGAGIFMTVFYCIGLLIRPKRKLLGLGAISVGLIAMYIASLYAMFTLR